MKEKLIEALNRLDERANYDTEDINEAKQQEADYNLLFDFLSGKQKLVIPFSEGDIQELQDGEEFNWSFETDKGEEIEIYITHERDEEYDEIVSN